MRETKDLIYSPPHTSHRHLMFQFKNINIFIIKKEYRDIVGCIKCAVVSSLFTFKSQDPIRA